MQTHLQPVQGDVTAKSVALTQRPGLLAIWHLLSLDAPCVVTAWTWLVAKTEHVGLPAIALIAMFLAVWTIYAADRLLDGSGNIVPDLEARHWFHRRHRFGFRVALNVASLMLIPFVLAMSSRVLLLYVGLAMLLAGWFVLVHLFARERPLTLPKELIPGPFCAAAVFIPAWASLGFGHVALAFGAATYALLVILNCLCIYKWEHDNLAGAHWSTRLGVRWLNPLGAAIIVLSLFTDAPIGIATALAAALLLTLNQLRTALDPITLRAASDLVLLTPILVVPFLR